MLQTPQSTTMESKELMFDSNKLKNINQLRTLVTITYKPLIAATLQCQVHEVSKDYECQAIMRRMLQTPQSTS